MDSISVTGGRDGTGPVSSKKSEMAFNEIDKAVHWSLGLAFSDDQEMAIRKAIISAFIAYENFEGQSHGG